MRNPRHRFLAQLSVLYGFSTENRQTLITGSATLELHY